MQFDSVQAVRTCDQKLTRELRCPLVNNKKNTSDLHSPAGELHAAAAPIARKQQAKTEYLRTTSESAT